MRVVAALVTVFAVLFRASHVKGDTGDPSTVDVWEWVPKTETGADDHFEFGFAMGARFAGHICARMEGDVSLQNELIPAFLGDNRTV
jgi:hypothetical protein